MLLDVKRANEIIEAREKRERLNAFIRFEQSLSFHSEPQPWQYFHGRSSVAATRFLAWVKGMLPSEKYDTFLSLFKFPLVTQSFTNELKAGVARVFQGSDAYIISTFADNDLKADWNTYRKTVANIDSTWRDEALERSFCAPQSALVVMSSSETSKPFYIWVELSDILDYDTVDGTQMSYLLYRERKDIIIGVTDEAWYRFAFDEAKGLITAVIEEVRHGLGYCPARFFWEDAISVRMKEFKKGVLGSVLNELDWYLFFSISKQHLDLYAPYPIYSAYASECHYENGETGEYCDGGYLRNSKGDYIFAHNGSLMKCPACSERRVAGPGSFLEIPVPSVTEGVADLRNPVQITGVDRDSLDYNTEEAERLRARIEHLIIGTVSEVSSKEAVSAGQLESSLEAKSRALLAIRHNFEGAQLFIERTMCRLLYGDRFISLDISLGSEFYTMSVTGYLAKYEEIKRAGVSEGLQDFYYHKLLDSATASSPDQVERQKILAKIEPFLHMDIPQVSNLIGRGVIDKRDTLLKLNFMNYIARFESEYTNVALYELDKPEATRLSDLKAKLYEYVDETIENSVDDAVSKSNNNFNTDLNTEQNGEQDE